MKKKFPLPLTVNCKGLSRKLIADLADRLSMLFEDVSIEGDDIIAHKPLGMNRYEHAWRLFDKFGVKVD